MIKLILLLAVLAFLPTTLNAQDATAPDGVLIYKRCAACHLPTGAGIPGAYPKLGAQVAGFSASKAGRDYLITVIAAGLMGELKLDGSTYHGYMPAQNALSDDQIAAVLNYVVKKIAKAPASVKEFSAAEANAARSSHKDAHGQESMKLRPLETIGKHGTEK